ncbi:MAG TPA: hypothetical protein VNM39_13225 [Verrucomicrobiae bacterium]|nr:hypothetical protein [Verrucomicrobiae bacterium]
MANDAELARAIEAHLAYMAERDAAERAQAEEIKLQLRAEIWTHGYLSAQLDARTGRVTRNPYRKGAR